LILFMLATIGLIQLGVGEQRRAARRMAPAALGMGRGTT
jgi:hypothetical protein